MKYQLQIYEPTKVTTNYEQNIFDAYKVFAEIDNALFQEKVQSIVVTSVF